ncbi:MAG: hypothetical protein JWM14_2066 [Chitinophagaceae bacterium]|nr:hypothetical protein [Chitinophagaceae bacterium]
MKKLSIIFICLCLWSMQAMAQTGTSSLVSIGPDGKLKYTPDAKGNVVPDYSAVGYKNGEAPIPSVPVVKTISAVSGDNTANIQNAINAVAALPMDANGIRGALLLKAGTYNINNTVYIRSSGVVLRGEGNSTILMATKTSQYNLISITGTGGASANTSTSKQLQGSYIAVGTKTFTLPAGHGFVTGDDVMLQRKPNQAWIHMLGMDVLSQIPCDDGGCNTDWTPAEYTINYIRKVVAVNGNSITLDAPNMDVIDSKYAQGFLMKYTWSGKIENAAVENMYIDSKYTNANDEAHGWNAVSFSNSKNGWVNNVEVHHFGYSAVTVNESAAFISVLNSKNLDPISQTIGGRKYSFNITGQRNLVKNCTTRSGRHDYVTGAQTAGPNVFVNSTATNQQADIGPHHRWATGVLFDVLTSNSLMDAQNRLGYGTGHGWSGSQIMFWNCTSAKFIVQSPPNHMNWTIGCKGTVTDKGDQYTGSPCINQSNGNFIAGIPSLYEKQLADRLNTTVPPVTPVPDNLAKGKTVTVSSTEASTTTSTVASNATDGSYETRWSSLFADPQWLSIDLGANYAVNRVKISWETAMASAYEIQLSSNGADWTSIKSVTGNTTTTNDQTGLSGTGRYVRIYGTARTTAYGYSIFEVEVYGAAANNVLPTVSLTSPASTDAFTAPASVTINATAADTDGTISKVDFYNGTTLLSSDATSPYSFAWTNVAAGTYSITAKATDNSGAAVTAAAVSITVNPAPPVCLPVSASGDDGNIPANVLDNNVATRWSATGDGQWIQFCQGSAVNISGVQIAFYSGNARQSIFDVQLSQDGLIWTNALTNVRSSGTSLALETFTFATQSAKYLRVLGHGNTVNAWNSYTEVKILTGEPPVNQLPSVAITAPTNNASFNAPASITITATAADVDGSVSKVDFYNGSTLLGSDVTSPYSYSWTAVAIGSYSITAVATDNLNATSTSSVVNVVVVAAPVNQAPTVTLTAPANNSSANAPASIAITATAADADGTISKVDFYNGTTLLGTDNTSPYSYTWTNVAAGTYAISAKATDNNGATATSSSASVKVNTVVVTNPCAGLPVYKENGGYAAGNKVQNAGKQYQCKPYPYSGWCNGSAWAYAPGVGSYWTDAWTLTGTCSSSREENTAEVNESLLTNAPNPFSSSTNLTVVVTESGNVSVAIYNKAGLLVKTVTDEHLNAGTYEFAVDGSDLPADLYIVKYTTAGTSITKKIIRTQ